MLLHIKFCEKQVSLINKLQPLSYQFTSNITPRLQFKRLNQPLKYATLLHYSHIPNTHKTTSHTPSTSTPKYTLLQRLVTCKGVFHEGRGPQVGEVTCGGLPHLTCKRDHIKMRDYMDRRVTPPKRVTSPT